MANKPKSKSKLKSRSRRISPDVLAQRRSQQRQKVGIRSIFSNIGFTRNTQATDKEFKYDGITSDFDDVYVLENVVVILEYTITASANLSGHLKTKAHLYKKIRDEPAAFISWAKGALGIQIGTYADYQVEVRVLYCSLNQVSAELKSQVPEVTYFDFEIVHYFQTIAAIIRNSGRWEFLEYLAVPRARFGTVVAGSKGVTRDTLFGSVLPEAHSNYPLGYKVVAVYASPDDLLKRAYVLRRDGWRNGINVYQRLLIKKKIEALRSYLLSERRVFVNNIIVTLPSSTKIVDEKDNTVDTNTLTSTTAVRITLPDEYNTVGIIDGQHRLFSYYEGGQKDDQIARLRTQQNLLVTGIIFPEGIGDREKERFQAQLFLEINSNQAAAKSDLKQAIQQFMLPFSDESIAKTVQQRLNEAGVFEGIFQEHLHETKKLKTTTVVSYGFKPLVRKKDGPLFDRWPSVGKQSVLEETNEAGLEEYISYCVSEIELFLRPPKIALHPNWRVKPEGGALTTTLVNGLLGAMRHGLAARNISSEDLGKKLSKISEADFVKYKSSQYTRMSTDLAEKYFGKTDSR